MHTYVYIYICVCVCVCVVLTPTPFLQVGRLPLDPSDVPRLETVFDRLNCSLRLLRPLLPRGRARSHSRHPQDKVHMCIYLSIHLCIHLWIWILIKIVL